MARRLLTAAAALAMLATSVAGVAQAAAEPTTAIGPYHVTGAPQEISPQAGEHLRAGAERQGLTSEWVTAWSYWKPDSHQGSNRVRLHVYTGSNGHDWAYAEGDLQYNNDGIYLDASQTSGNGHWPWQAVNLVKVTGPLGGLRTPSTDDGPGHWVRACGASFWRGDPWGAPNWGYNIACTDWN
ncbi:hypothetical protein [Kitasatospora purpeofusca]|uniref:hypothetical protein n=1 Tax=Kitasatospora purpeofusca TaxID=67352 RepID=UPI0036686A36